MRAGNDPERPPLEVVERAGADKAGAGEAEPYGVEQRPRSRTTRRFRWQWWVVGAMGLALVLTAVIYEDKVGSYGGAVTGFFKSQIDARQFDPQYVTSEISQAINEYREEQGRTPLLTDARLAGIAQAHSDNMAQYGYSRHVDSRGDNPSARAIKAGYDCHNPQSIGIAENINVLEGHHRLMTNDEVVSLFVESWIASPGHQRNILDPRYGVTGVGTAVGDYNGSGGAIHVTQNFC